MKHTFLFLAMLPIVGMAKNVVVTSPDGQLAVTVSDEAAQATYAVSLNGQQVVQQLTLTSD